MHARMPITVALLRSISLLAALWFAAGAAAADDPAAAGNSTAQAPAAKEAVRVCTKCHDETEKRPVLSIMKSKHAVMADKRTPFADEACITCHGKSEAHIKATPEGQKRTSPDVVFGAKSPTPITVKNETCLSCHAGGLRIHWKGSAHEFQNIACASCHTVHTGQDPVLVKLTQPDTCLTCHKEKRAEIHRPSTHPIVQGKTACSDCHNPHGSSGPKMLVKGTTNETCYTCHAEKRGPFLWEHAPVREDCTLCHKPHGSVHANLLKNRGPWLCQQCHLAQFHPSTAYSGTGLPTGTIPSGTQQLLGKNCLNCHVQVHGSNHPSGVRKTR